MKKHLHSFVFVSIILLNFGCEKNLTGPQNPFTISVEDVSCTEAWIKLSVNNLQLPANISLLRDEKEVMNFTITTKDTTVYTDSLLPKRTYTYHAVLQSQDNKQLTSNKTAAVTMDTTSHQFTWQTFTFGEYDNSVLYDVAIINENNIWAVGEIYMKDSLGNTDPEQYAVAHWNGLKWELMKLKSNCRLYYPNCGPITMLISTGYSIFARNENDIWIAAGSVHHFDGNSWTEEAGILGAGDAHKIWGNSNELWFVGSCGFIAHRNPNGSWQKIESGTTLSINDIWGSYDNVKKEWEILCIASNQFIDEGKKLLSIVGNRVATLPDDDLSWSLNAIWFENGRKYIIGGDGLYISNTNSAIWKRDYSQPPYYKTAVRGIAINDIFVVGAFGLALHFNGYSWHNYQTTINLNNGSFGRVEFKNNIVIAVGGQATKGIISIGRR